MIRLRDGHVGREVALALAEGGVTALEVTMTVPGAVGLIEQLAQALPANVLIGAGTVLDPETARSVILAGARFVVSPVLRPEVIALCHRYDVAAMPGCFTPTEILTAWEAGADVVKVFPATALGPGFFKDLRGPLPQVKLMPTGGVTRENAGDWIRAGACAIGVGTALVDVNAVAERRFGDISAAASHFVQAVAGRARGRRACGGRAMKTVCFGEIMLRLSPPGFERFFQSPHLQASFGGGEANVAVSLAHFGADSHYVTRVPANPIGDAAVRALRAEGVKVDHVVRGGSRLGIYFAETGASQRASVGRLRPRPLRGERARRPVSCHGPTCSPARPGSTSPVSRRHSDPIAACTTREAVEAARRAGARVSVDLNFRRKLWSEQQAQSVMRPLMPLVDLVIANEEDLQAVLGIDVPHADVTGASLDLDGYRSAAERVTKEFGVAMVAVTLRESVSASDNAWSALLLDGASGEMHHSQRYDVRLVDRIGGGDSFAAGLIHGLGTGRAPAQALRFAVAASALKQTIPGDFNRVSEDEVERLAGGDASGRVQR